MVDLQCRAGGEISFYVQFLLLFLVSFLFFRLSFSSAADPGCLSQIQVPVFFSFPDPTTTKKEEKNFSIGLTLFGPMNFTKFKGTVS